MCPYQYLPFALGRQNLSPPNRNALDKNFYRTSGMQKGTRQVGHQAAQARHKTVTFEFFF